MKVKSQVLSVIANAIAHSFSLKLTLNLATDFIPSYNIHERLGYPPSMPVQPLDAAQRVVRDLYDAGFLFEMIEWIANVNKFGYMGQKYPVAGFPGIILAIRDSGYLFDEASQSFFENPNIQKTRSWGRLLEGKQYTVTLLKLDIVSNSSLVRENEKKDIDSAYKIFFENVRELIEKRNG